MSKTNGIYICVFGTGMVKIGRGVRVEDRISSHKSAAKCFGVTMLASSIYACGDTVTAERELIEWCLRNSQAVVSKEWFHGVDIGACQAKAEDIASRHLAFPTQVPSTVFETVMKRILPSVEVTREHAAYVKARQMIAATGCLTDSSFSGMDSLHDLCENIRKYTACSGERAPAWFDELNCMEAWEIDLMFCDGVPEETLIENINRAFESIKAEVRKDDIV